MSIFDNMQKLVRHASFRKHDRSSLFIKGSKLCLLLTPMQEALILLHSGRRGILRHGTLQRREESLENGKISATQRVNDP